MGRPSPLGDRLQAASRQPDADAVMHQHFHAIGALVGEQIGLDIFQLLLL